MIVYFEYILKIILYISALAILLGFEAFNIYLLLYSDFGTTQLYSLLVAFISSLIISCCACLIFGCIYIFKIRQKDNKMVS